MKLHTKQPRKEHLELCGFVCPACNFRLLLSDPYVSRAIVDLLNHGLSSSSLKCPECGHEHQYGHNDLFMFLPGGKQAPFSKRLTLRDTA